MDTAVADAVVQENTDFFDAAFPVSDELKNATQDGTGYSLLHYAARYSSERMVKYFLDKGFPIDSRTLYGQTALHVAAAHCRRDVVKLLLQQGCSVDARDSMGRTALNYAMEVGTITLRSSDKSSTCQEERSESQFSSTDNHDIIDHLLRHGPNVNIPTEEDDTPLFQAIERGSESLVRLFLEHDANVNHLKNGQNALHYAAERSSRIIVEILLDAGAEVNGVTTKDRRTALHLAAISASSREIVDLLIQRGAMVNARDLNDEAPIAVAVQAASVQYEHRNLFGDMLDNVRNVQGLRAARVRVRREEVRVDVFAHLRTLQGDNIRPADRYNQQIQQNKRRYKIIHSLLDAGAEVDFRTAAGEPAFHRVLSTGIESIIVLFLERGVDIHSKNTQGWSALHTAVQYASEKVVEMLIERGVPIDERISRGNSRETPLQIAVQLHKKAHIKLLLDKGADVNATDFRGRTPLHYTARLPIALPMYHPSIQNIARILLDNGADPLISSTDDKTPLNDAVRNQSNVMIDALLRHLALLEAMGERRGRRASEVVMNGIGNDVNLQQVYENKHQREMASMKEEKIHENISYFDMIISDLQIWVKNDEFVKAFKNNHKIKELYCYEKVRKKFDVALKRHELSKSAIEYLSELLSHAKLPIPIIEMIVIYYKLDDLEKFVRSCKEDDKVSPVNTK